MDESLIIYHRLVTVGVYKTRFNNVQLVDAILRTVQARYQLDVGDVVGWMHDRASVNTAAIEALLLTYVGSHDLECLSHTICHCGDKMLGCTAFAKTLMAALTNIMSSSNRTSNYWREVTGATWKQPSNVRWWAKWHLYVEVWNKYRQAVQFVQTARVEGNCVKGNSLNLFEPFMLWSVKKAGKTHTLT